MDPGKTTEKSLAGQGEEYIPELHNKGEKALKKNHAILKNRGSENINLIQSF